MKMIRSLCLHVRYGRPSRMVWDHLGKITVSKSSIVHVASSLQYIRKTVYTTYVHGCL
jgi:hypothetical protein